jgi:hypothetical protein
MRRSFFVKYGLTNTPVRRVISLVLALALFVNGAGILVEFADHFRGWSVVMACALMVDMPQKYRGLRLGVRPLLGVKRDIDRIRIWGLVWGLLKDNNRIYL